jgi:hypothetical protein
MSPVDEKLHHIRNQLAAVTGYASLLAMSDALSAEHRAMAEKIAAAGLEIAADLQATVDLAAQSAAANERHLGGHDGHELNIGSKR